MNIKEFVHKEEIKKAWQEFYPGNELPDELFDRKDGKFIAIGLFREYRLIGMVTGGYNMQEDYCLISTFHIEREHAGRRILISFLDSILSILKDEYAVKKVLFSMAQETSADSVIASSLKYISCAEVSDVKYLRRICVKTSDCVNFRNMKWYKPQLLNEKGYEAVPIKNVSADRLKMIEKPEDWEKDEETSVVLFHKGSDVPAGWILTEKDSRENAVTVRRFYVSPEERSRMIGYAFLAGVVEEIIKSSENVCFCIERGNRQMERFADRYKYYFGYDLGKYDYYECIINVELKEK